MRCLATIVLLGITGLSSPAFGQATAMVAYGVDGSSTPRYRTWGGSSWSAQASANSVGGTPLWVVLAGSPSADEYALAVLDSSEDVNVQTWDGSAWSSVTQVTSDTGSTSTRCMDVAFESNSGEALIVYRESGTNQVRYRTFDGSSWSGESSVSTGNTTIRWLKLVPDPDSDEIVLLAYHQSTSLYLEAVTWDGSSWGSSSTLLYQAGSSGDDDDCGGTTTSYAAFDGVFDASGDMMSAYFCAGSYTPRYRTLSGGSWSSQASSNSVGSNTYFLRLAADTESDEIILVTLDSSEDLNVNVWNGSSWSGVTQHEGYVESSSRRGFDIAYEHGGDEALLLYNESGSAVQYRTWNGSSWGSEVNGPGSGSIEGYIQARTGIAAGEIFVFYTRTTGGGGDDDDGGSYDPYLDFALWDGSSMSSGTNMCTSSASTSYESFMVATANTATSSTPTIVRWREIEPN